MIKPKILSAKASPISNFISNHGIAKTATYLSQESVTNMITKYADQLMLGIRGCVCGISCSLKMISQVCVAGRDSEIEQGPEVAIVYLELLNLCHCRDDHAEQYSDDRTRRLSLRWSGASVCFSGWSLSFHVLAEWPLSRLPLIHSTKASQAATAALWYSLSAW